MPSLFRFLFVLAVLAGLVYGGAVALTVFVEPKPREMTVKIPAKRLNP
ncbi:MAG: histidine kinase [Pseudomonadota bacterium]